MPASSAIARNWSNLASPSGSKASGCMKKEPWLRNTRTQLTPRAFMRAKSCRVASASNFLPQPRRPTRAAGIIVDAQGDERPPVAGHEAAAVGGDANLRQRVMGTLRLVGRRRRRVQRTTAPTRNATRGARRDGVSKNSGHHPTPPHCNGAGTRDATNRWELMLASISGKDVIRAHRGVRFNATPTKPRPPVAT